MYTYVCVCLFLGRYIYMVVVIHEVVVLSYIDI